MFLRIAKTRSRRLSANGSKLMSRWKSQVAAASPYCGPHYKSISRLGCTSCDIWILSVIQSGSQKPTALVHFPTLLNDPIARRGANLLFEDPG